MKAAHFLLASLLSTAIAAADPYYGPPGAYGQPAPAPMQVAGPVQVVALAGPPAGMLVPADQVPLRQAILARFDRNHDGVLEPEERRHAIRALRKLTRRMARQQARQQMRAERRASGDFE